jgi:DNA-binding LacI/PurR family transcriptional regulator
MKKSTIAAKAKRPMPRNTAPAGAGRLQMEDIAELAGVSTSTVSRALNQSSLVNEETRQRIERLAQSLGYSVNVGASNLRLQRNRTVAVVLPLDHVTRQQVTDPFFISILGNLADALTARGYDMLLSRIDADKLNLAGDLSASGRAIGVILIGQWHHHDQLNDLAARKSPLVVWGAHLPQQMYCTIGGDNIAGGMLATEHLIESGHRRIAFFGDVELPEIAQRFEGYQLALEKHALGKAPDLIHHVPFIEDGARAAVGKLLANKTRFDAIFASSDMLAMETISALRANGLHVPSDVGVVGYDDIVLARYCHPALTTIRQPVLAGAEALVDALLRLVDGKRPKSETLPTELIVRESSVKSAAAL